MADWKDILSGNDEQLTEEELLMYLDENVPEEEKRTIENKISNNPFELDALQGLLQVQNKDNLSKHVKQLNQKLQQLTAKRHRKEKRKINIFQWMLLALGILLFTCIIGYIIIWLHNKTAVHTELMSPAKAALWLLQA